MECLFFPGTGMFAREGSKPCRSFRWGDVRLILRQFNKLQSSFAPRRIASIWTVCLVLVLVKAILTYDPHQICLNSLDRQSKIWEKFLTGSVVKMNWIYALCDVRWQYAAMLKIWYVFQCSRNIWDINPGASVRLQISILLTYIIAAVLIPVVGFVSGPKLPFFWTDNLRDFITG